MKVDVSEIKTFKACKRQWQLSSRNKFHLRSKAPAPSLLLGTMFHEALAELYLGARIESVMDWVTREMDPEKDRALLAMLPGYAREVLPEDLDRFKVLETEHHFELDPVTLSGEVLDVPDLKICGSIDLIALDRTTNQIFGFEHKTCAQFRDETYLWMDEQPRVYTWALLHYVDEYNAAQQAAYADALLAWELGQSDTEPVAPEPATLGGVYLNEVKKLLRQFQHKRTLCTYSLKDLEYFMSEFFADCTSCSHMVQTNAYAAPQPSYFGCSSCAFRSVCATYMYDELSKEQILSEFSGELEARTEDHLEEKAERHGAE